MKRRQRRNGSLCNGQHMAETDAALMAASWTQKLRAHANRTKPKAARPRKPRPEVQETWAQVRAPSGNDPGEVIPVFYTVGEGVLTVTDEKGVALKEIRPHTLLQSENAASLAGHFTMARRRSDDPNGDGQLRFGRFGGRTVPGEGKLLKLGFSVNLFRNTEHDGLGFEVTGGGGDGIQGIVR